MLQPCQMWTQDELPLARGKVRTFVMLSTAFGAVAIDADWYDRNVVLSSEWRRNWLELLEQLEASQALCPALFAYPEDSAEPFDELTS